MSAGPPRFVKPGRPAQVAVPAAVAVPSPPFEPPPVAWGGGSSGFGVVEVIALVGLGAGWLAPGIGLLAGVVALLISPRWTAGEKALAILLPVVLVVIPFIEFLHTVFSPGLQGVVDATTWFAVMCVLGLTSWPGAAIFLWVRARRRRAPSAGLSP